MTRLNEIVFQQHAYFETQITKNSDFRINALKNLKKQLVKNEQKFYEAFNLDFSKPKMEVFLTEYRACIKEINMHIRKTKIWIKAKKVKTPITSLWSKTFIMPQPYGVAFISSPWNYPLLLTIIPLIGAISAGNCVILKLASSSKNVSTVIRELISSTFESNYIYALDDTFTHKDLLQPKYDKIFFTGSAQTGKLMMKKAAEDITSITLELGGKSPCIVDESANLLDAAKKIVWGKFLNAGQTCVAPDYLLVNAKVYDKLLEYMKKYILEFYTITPLDSLSLASIINLRHFDRLLELMKNQEIYCGGQTNRENKKIAPTIIKCHNLDNTLMQEEIFGPLLPVIKYNKIDDAIAIIKTFPHPLSFYIFSDNKFVQAKVIKILQFGGGCINNTLMHVNNLYAPFGGVGLSGFGRYHGKYSFDSFSYLKTILTSSDTKDLKQKYPPYSDKKFAAVKKLLKFFQ